MIKLVESTSEFEIYDSNSFALLVKTIFRYAPEIFNDKGHKKNKSTILLIFGFVFCVAPKAEYVEYATFDDPQIRTKIPCYICKI